MAESGALACVAMDAAVALDATLLKLVPRGLQRKRRPELVCVLGTMFYNVCRQMKQHTHENVQAKTHMDTLANKA